MKLLKSKIFLVIILIISIIVWVYINEDNDLKKEQVIIDKVEIEQEPFLIKEYKFSLLATGDALIHSPIYNNAKTANGYNFDDIFTEITDVLEDYDLKFINQETPFANKAASSYPRFNTPTQWGDSLVKAGFNLISLANNHTMDQNAQGVIDTLDYWNNQIGVKVSGTNYSEDDNRYIIDTINEITYGFVAYTEHTNGLTAPVGSEYLVNIYSEESAKEDIENLKKEVDVIIVSMHWGDEYTSEPNEYQKTVANQLAEMGVDIILGNHAHWIQPIEYINETLVIYSMGNFISNQMTIANQSYYSNSVTVGAFVMMDINKVITEYEEDVFVDNLKVELIYSYKSSSSKYKVVPFSKMNSKYSSNYKSLYEKHVDRIQLYNQSFDVIGIN